jgi:hypothetical protein
MKGRQKVWILKEQLNKDASNFAKITLPRNFKIGGQVIYCMKCGMMNLCYELRIGNECENN